jgi:dihydrofolate reductase
MRRSLIVAAAENGVIGVDNRLPWRLPADLARFKQLTMGHHLIMGRKTYESIGKPLEGRDSIVVTRRRDFAVAGVRVATSVEEAIDLGRELAEKRGVDEVMVIGGEGIFRAALADADRIYLTLVHGTPAGDTRFALPDAPAWRETAREPMPQGSGDEYPADFIVLERQG